MKYLTPEEISQIKQLRKEGWSSPKIATKFNRSTATILHHWKTEAERFRGKTVYEDILIKSYIKDESKMPIVERFRYPFKLRELSRLLFEYRINRHNKYLI